MQEEPTAASWQRAETTAGNSGSYGSYKQFGYSSHNLGFTRAQQTPNGLSLSCRPPVALLYPLTPPHPPAPLHHGNSRSHDKFISMLIACAHGIVMGPAVANFQDVARLGGLPDGSLGLGWGRTGRWCGERVVLLCCAAQLKLVNTQCRCVTAWVMPGPHSFLSRS